MDLGAAPEPVSFTARIVELHTSDLAGQAREIAVVYFEPAVVCKNRRRIRIEHRGHLLGANRNRT